MFPKGLSFLAPHLVQPQLLSLLIDTTQVPVTQVQITTAGAPELITNFQFPFFPVIWKFSFLKLGFLRKHELYFEHLQVHVWGR